MRAASSSAALRSSACLRACSSAAAVAFASASCSAFSCSFLLRSASFCADLPFLFALRTSSASLSRRVRASFISGTFAQLSANSLITSFNDASLSARSFGLAPFAFSHASRNNCAPCSPR